MTTGSDRTRLIVLRGNSGAGKSTVAAELRAYGTAGFGEMYRASTTGGAHESA